MAAPFSPRATMIARVALAVGLALVIATPAIAMLWVRLPRARGVRQRIVQPIPFDHRLHAGPLRIDCRYCHAGAERTAWAGLPSSQQCVPCHTATWLNTRDMSALRRSLASGTPIPWRRVTQLPDFVYFNHAAHVTKGVRCETCHGQVNQMAEVAQVAPLTMNWCVECHRAAPERYHARALTNCTTCHR